MISVSYVLTVGLHMERFLYSNIFLNKMKFCKYPFMKVYVHTVSFVSLTFAQTSQNHILLFHIKIFVDYCFFLELLYYAA